MIELTAQSKVSPDPEVIFTEMQKGESVLLHLGTNRYFSLNETGTHIWKWISEGCTVGEVRARLVNKYEVSADKAEQSVKSLLGELIGEKLVLLAHEG